LVRQPPKRIDCSYLLTAWTAGSTGPQLVLEEHELLGQAVQVFARYPTIPARFLQGGLKGQELPLPLNVGGTNAGEVKDPADFWSALGNKLRPSLVLTVTLELPAEEPEPAPLVGTHELRLGLRNPAAETGLIPATAEELFRVGGLVTDEKGRAVAGAKVSGVGVSATTDGEGRYALGPLPGGAHSLSVSAGARRGSFKVVVPAPAGETYDFQLPG
ncbi:MAG TPA: Pvc16 family protein, partial [Pyrinomonadaceae bacterium]